MSLKPTLHAQLVAIGAEIDSHESDLYVKDSPAVRATLPSYVPGEQAKPFRHAVTGELWWDCPFAFEPWWEARQGKAGA